MRALEGTRVLQIAGLGAVPFAGMMLADMGADVIRLDRPPRKGAQLDAYEQRWRASDPRVYALDRGRRSVIVDLKSVQGADLVLSLVEKADVLLEGFRPGVMERLGLGPDECLARNPALVYGRLTGWGQTGPLAPRAGHDLTYLALSGALHGLVSASGEPITPPALVADFGGGGLLMAYGVLCGLVHARATGHGQVVDSAMVDGVAILTTLLHSLLAQGRWSDQPGRNFGDGDAPFYSVYRTSDDKFVAVAASESQFYDVLLTTLGLTRSDIPSRDDPAQWPALRKVFTEIFAARTRDEWDSMFAGTDGCVSPVLSLTEAPEHPHNVERSTFVSSGGVMQPAPAPRLSLTPAQLGSPPPVHGEHTREALLAWGLAESDIDALLTAGTVQQA